MEPLLYIVFGMLVAAAVAMQVWMMRTTARDVPASRQPLVIALRWFNVVALLVLAGLVAYLLSRS